MTPASPATGAADRTAGESTLTAWIAQLVASHADATALIEPEGTSVSFRELADRSARLAAGLRSLGLGHGDRLLSFVPNSILAIEVLLAAARIGAVTIGVNTRYRVHDLRHVVEQARPRILVRGEDFLGIDFAAVVGGALEGVAHRPRVLSRGEIEGLRGEQPATDDDAHPADLLVAFTTSGTTGQPKLAAHGHAATVRHLHAVARSFEVQRGSTGLVVLPFCGTFGFVTLLGMLAGGGRAVVPARFDAREAAMLVEQYDVTHLNGSDDMLVAVLAQDRDLSSWRHGVHAEFNGRGLECVRAAVGVGARVTGVYGSSETFALLARWPESLAAGSRARNGGVLLDEEMEVRAVDPATGRPVAPGTAGELQVRGPSTLSGYLEPGGTRPPSLTDDGWLSTGDLGTVEADRSFLYRSRMGDALRLAGFLTDPAEIEQHLLRHPAVDGAQVVGAPGPSGAEAVVAFVTVGVDVGVTVGDTAGDTVSGAGAAGGGSGGVGELEEALREHCRQGLANYKVPARVVVLPHFPVVDGPNGTKVRRNELRDLAASLTR